MSKLEKARQQNVDLSIKNATLNFELEELRAKLNERGRDPEVEALVAKLQDSQEEFRAVINELKERRARYDKLLEEAKGIKKDMVRIMEENDVKIPWWKKLKYGR